jgi:hypothetical protein
MKERKLFETRINTGKNEVECSKILLHEVRLQRNSEVQEREKQHLQKTDALLGVCFEYIEVLENRVEELEKHEKK